MCISLFCALARRDDVALKYKDKCEAAYEGGYFATAANGGAIRDGLKASVVRLKASPSSSTSMSEVKSRVSLATRASHCSPCAAVLAGIPK